MHVFLKEQLVQPSTFYTVDVHGTARKVVADLFGYTFMLHLSA